MKHIKHIRNLTPHDAVVIKDDSRLIYEAEAVSARVHVILDPIESDSDCPLFKETYGQPVGLPDPEEGVILIVSGIMCTALPDRTDLVHPVGLVRDKTGAVIGCQGLCR